MVTFLHSEYRSDGVVVCGDRGGGLLGRGSAFMEDHGAWASNFADRLIRVNSDFHFTIMATLKGNGSTNL